MIQVSWFLYVENDQAYIFIFYATGGHGTSVGSSLNKQRTCDDQSKNCLLAVRMGFCNTFAHC